MLVLQHHYQNDTHTHPFNGPFPGLPRWAGTRKVRSIWILLPKVKSVWILQKQVTVSDSGISWAICKSAPRSRQITTPAPGHSVFYRPDALPAAQPTVSKHWRDEWMNGEKINGQAENTIGHNANDWVLLFTWNPTNLARVRSRKSSRHFWLQKSTLHTHIKMFMVYIIQSYMPVFVRICHAVHRSLSPYKSDPSKMASQSVQTLLQGSHITSVHVKCVTNTDRQTMEHVTTVAIGRTYTMHDKWLNNSRKDHFHYELTWFKTFTPSCIGCGRPANDCVSFFTRNPTNLARVCSRNSSRSFWLQKSTRAHTHMFNGPFSGTIRVSRYQKGKTNLDFTEARDSEWQRHQLGHIVRLIHFRRSC